jgi:DNA polymerase-4
MGAKLLRTAAITGIKEIGEVAALSVQEAISIFGKQGLLLRNMAQGVDNSRVEERNGKRRITQQADFNEDIVDLITIRGTIQALAEHGGLQMRRDKLGATIIRLVVVYSDDINAEGQEKQKRRCVLDFEIAGSAERVFHKTAVRRIRIRSIGLSLEGLIPLGFEPDLFEPETEIKDRSLQEAVDKIQNRYGVGKITKGLVLEAKKMRNENKEMMLISGAAFAD